MEKMEYKTKIEEMKDFAGKKKFADALAIADSINWRKVQNINDLIVGSEAYESAGKNDEARELLLLAHERSPIGRMIIYRLCMISIKMGELDTAQEYYNEYVTIAPHDSLKYILKYNISVAKGADNATLIKILEQLKDQDFIEEWAYELAYLYHRTNQGDKCIALCDEIVLWFGDGPVVERALELKMLYQPLDKTQENKYKNLQEKKDGLTEITATPSLGAKELKIKEVPKQEPITDRFDTINLQAEIKKNIEEIMNATEKGEVSENIDAIKSLVEEIPYLQVQEESVSEESEPEEVFSINETFNAFLEEGFDGQISLRLPEENSSEETQIEGQMTIDDVLAEWEKTKRAAEAALEQAKRKELEDARAKALKEANQVLSRLESAINKIENGFSIPKLDADGTELGTIDIPVVKVEPSNSQQVAETIIPKEEIEEEPANWQPTEFEENDDVDYKEASQIIADVNKMLQQEIDRLTEEGDAAITAASSATVEEPVAVFEGLVEESTETSMEMSVETVEEIIEAEPEVTVAFVEEEIVEAKPEYVFEEEEKVQLSTEYEDIVQPDPMYDNEIDLPEIKLPDDLFAEDEAVSEPLVEPQIIKVAEKDIVEKEEQTSISDISDDDLSVFSYFLPIKGMKENIAKVLDGAIAHLNNPNTVGGNIVIVGDNGAGKTQMATNIVAAIQNKTGKPTGGVGKITGENLNTKDVQKLFSRIQGGCLIIEGAGDIEKETAVTFSLLMDSDTAGTLVIIEDTKENMDRLLNENGSLAKKFTETIIIPTFSIDELVAFAKTYARESGYAIDEMGTLALYNRINNIAKFDHSTTISEVAQIVDEGIRHSSKGGFFNKPKFDDEGYIILKEKDFDN